MIQSKDIQLDWPFEYHIKEGDPSRLLVLLHGYQQNGFWIYKKLRDLNFPGTIISPNAIFPIPVKYKGGWHIFGAWYFYNPDTNEYVIDMDPAISYLLKGLEEWTTQAKKIQIVGFSQGGYLSPFLAKELPATSQIIGIGSRFRDEKLTDRYDFRFDAIHGEKDTGVEYKRSKRSFDSIIERGNEGSYHIFEDMGHEISEDAIAKIQELIDQ